MTKGFSLVEMLVAVVIIGILAFYGVTGYQVAADKARFETHRSLVEAVARAEHAYYYGAGEYTNDLSILAVHIPAEDPIHWKDVQTGESLPGFYTDKEESVFYRLEVQEDGKQLLLVVTPITPNDFPVQYVTVLIEGETKWRNCLALDGTFSRGRRLCKALGGKEYEKGGFFL